MARYQMILAYDGTEFSGFQRQAKRITDRTVQGEIEKALRLIGWMGKSIMAAGRTDTGVHAAGQVVAFDHEWRHSDFDLLTALNANLPQDIAIQQLSLTRSDFHPRFDAIWRRYQYRIICQPVRDPLRERYAWRVWPTVNGNLLNLAAACLIGEHDFGAFGSAPVPGGTTIREVIQAEWKSDQDSYIFVIKANAFLYRMVRRIVGCLIQIGQGKMHFDMLDFYLRDEAKKLIKSVAPANGLTLIEVGYVNREQ